MAGKKSDTNNQKHEKADASVSVAAPSKASTKNKQQSSAEAITDFPRGGSSGLTPLEFREVSRQAEREVLFTDGVISSQADKKKRRHDIGSDNESAATTTGDKKKSKKKSKKLADAGADADIDKVNPVEHLSFKKLAKGALILGCVAAVQDLQLRISLPNGLIGSVPITSISPELTALVEKAAEDDEDSMDVDSEEGEENDPLNLRSRFFVGQLVKCVITELGDSTPASKKKPKSKAATTRIELTLMPEEINNRIDIEDLCEGLILTASVKSVEDRGYVLNTGFPGDNITAFLPTAAAQAWLDRWMPQSTELKVGQLVEASITNVTDNHRTLRVTLDPTVVGQSLVKDTYRTMASVQPGQLVSANIMKIWDRGLSMRFMGFYDCTADLTGIGMLDARDSKDVEKSFKLGQTISVRVVYVSLTAAAKIIIVSALPHITAFTPRPALTCFELPEAARLATGISDTEFVPGTDEKLWPIPYGTVINDCVVANIVSNLGLVLQIPGALSVRAFVPAAYLVEDGDAAPTLNRHIGRFRIDTRHRARVIGYDAMDAVIRVSLRPSVVDEKYFTIDDVFPGAIINGAVKRLLDKGAEVVISSNLIGFVHKQELSDTKLKHPELQFKAEKKVTCRVLKILHEKRSVLLTCRKSLVQSKLPTVFGYTEAEGAVPGTITMATVDRLVAGGAVINFYQGAHGFVPTGTKQLAVGQAVKCRILSANAEKRRISATLDVDENSELSELVDRSKIRANNEFSTDLSQVTTGQVVGGSVTRVADGYITVRLDGSNLRASMSVAHLSDHRGTILDKIVARTIEGTHLPELVITSIVEKKGRIAVSAKPALIKAAKAGNLPATANDITVGQTMVGWISNTATFGVFVNFPGMITALAPLDMLADRYVAAPSDLFSKDQTVIASVVGIDESKDGNKVRVALKSSVVDTAATGFLSAADYLLGYFNEIESAAGSSAFDCIGAQALVTVKQKHPYGLVVSPASGGKLPESSSGFITINQAKDRIDECSEGTTVAACVLDVDAEKNIVDFSLRSVLVSEASGLEDASKANGSVSADKKMAKLQAKIDAKIDTSRKGLQEAVKKSQETQLVIEIVKEDYLVLSMPLFGNSIAFAATKSYNDCSKPFMRFKVGQRLNGTPVRAAAEGKRTLVLLQRGSDRLSEESSGNGDKAKRAAVKPVDSAINFFEDYQPGVMTKAIVSGIKGGQANLNLASNVKGRLHITELLDDYAAVAEAKSPADVFAAAGVCVGMTIDVKVLGWHDAKVYKFLPITHRASPMKTVIETTVKPSEMATKSGKVLTNGIRLATPKTIAAGQVIHGFVKGILEASGSRTASVMVILGLSLIGYMPILAATSSYKVATHPGRFFIPGMPIEVQVAAVDSNGKSVTVVPHGNYIANVEKPLSSIKQLVPGARVVTSVTAINPSAIFTGFSLVLTEGEDKLPRLVHVHGNVSQFDISDKLTATPFKDFTKGKLLDAVVVSVENSETPENMKAILSLRQSALTPEKYTPSDIADPVIGSAADVAHGQIVRGFIKQTSEIGCFIVIGRNMSGRAIISELSDEYVRDVKAAFPPGKFVTAAVIDSNHSANKISLSLRASRVGGIAGTDGDKLRRLDQINVGETLKGTITRIEDYGVFIKPDNSFVTGLCYLREIADSDVPVNPKTLYELGDRVLAKVLKVDASANRLALGLKASYFAKEDSDDEDDEVEESDDEDEASNAESADEDAESDEEEEEDDDENMNDSDVIVPDSASEAESGSESDSDSDVEMEDVSKPALAVSGGFQWEEDSNDEAERDSAAGSDSDSDDSSDDEDDEAQQQKKKTKRSKLQKISQDITAELSEQAPTSSSHFERLIVGSPNSSFVWLQFMAYYLGLSEVDQARAVAERALKTISPSEEQEKMNVWVALLNLEHRFGTKSTLDEVLKRTVQFMNPKHVYLQMAKIYERADQFAEAESMHKVAITKFAGSCKVWVLFGLFYLKNNKVAESRDLLARALKSLPKRKHIKAITQFGQMEFKHGEPERGRTVFEGILGTYPKRVDLWSVYLDMEVKAVTIHGLDESDKSGRCWDATRNLFARVTSMKHSSKKMKFFFKKWLAFEKTHGSDDTIEHVKEKALEYVNSLSS